MIVGGGESDMLQTVLILDDEPDNVALVDVSLRRHLVGVETATFTAPRAAADWCARHEPDLCLIDYKMPDMTGIDFIRQVRQHPHIQSVPMIMITGQPDARLQHAALDAGATDFLSKPYNVDDVVVRTRNHLRLREKLRERRADVGQLEQAMDSALRAIEHEQLQIIQCLTRLSGYRDEETVNHMRRVGHLSRMIADELGLGSRFADQLLLAAPLHDIGKVGIPDRVLLKPRALDTVEREIMQTHARIGYELLKDSGSEVMRLAAEIAHTHHETWDGQGYPNRLVGEAIPVAGRIVATVDVFDALINSRHYKPAWSLDDTLALLQRERNRHFDASCVDVLVRRIDDAMGIQQQFSDELCASQSVLALRHAGVPA